LMHASHPHERSDSEASPRPFGLGDGMILIAGLFIALAWDRPRVLDPLLRVSEPAFYSWWLAEEAASIIALLLQLLVVASLTVLAVRLRPRRPSLGRLLQQPGAAACALASAASIAVGSMVVASHVLSGRPLAVAWSRAATDLKPDKLLIVAVMIGMAVLTAWIVMLAKRQWRPEFGWIDRFGRLVGLGWIAMIPGGMFLLILRLVGLIHGLS
jgi:hypothetical protein